MSFREAYPRFSSLRQSLQWQARWFACGIQDAFQWTWLLRILYHDAQLRSHLFKSLLLNGVSLLSIYAVESLASPHLREQTRWIHRHLGSLYNLLWLSPILGASFYLNATWCQFIAQRALALQRGPRSSVQPPMSYRGMINAIASSAYRIIMLTTSLAIGICLGLIPTIGPFLSFVFLCWTNSYYCFEFLWIAKGFSLRRRIRHLEERWAYYFAFGIPSAFFCATVTGLAGVAVFALVFPTYIVMATRAKPVPLDPYNPGAALVSEDAIVHPSPFIPIRLPIFTLVLWLDDTIVQIFRVGSGNNRRLSFSDASERAEDGGTSKLGSYALPQGTQRIHLTRRKED